ncbi:MAG: TlpA family protein disulfide reductase [Ktedonobacteraceae bacterium]|nr:TlpA family protein disulfide reductase [Ktedonobacteraceae bacterium]
MAKLIMRGIIVITVLAVLAIITLGLLQPAEQSAPAAGVGIRQGMAAPNFTLSTPDGKKISLSDYRGRPVMLNFWYINCPGCSVEIPDLQQTYASQQAAPRDFVILGINIVDTASDIRQFAHQQHITYPLLPDDGSRVRKLYGITAAPTSYFLDRRGIIRQVVQGPVDKATLQRILSEISA